MLNRPRARVFVLASILAATLTAPAAFLIVLCAASAGWFDGGAMMTQTSGVVQRAVPYAIVGGCYGLALGPALIIVKPYWAGVKIMIIPFAIPTVLALITGKPLDAIVLILVAVAIGLIARVSANTAVARLE